MDILSSSFASSNNFTSQSLSRTADLREQLVRSSLEAENDLNTDLGKRLEEAQRKEQERIIAMIEGKGKEANVVA